MDFKTKNVLHVITSLSDGGAEALLYRLCLSTDNFGIHHHIISLKEMGKYGELFIQKGISVECLNISRYSDLPAATVKLYELIKNLKPCTVQTWLYHADFLGGVCAKAAGVKSIIWSIHNTVFPRKMTSWRNWCLVKLLAVLSFFIPTKIVCCSESARESHLKTGYCKSKLLTIWNGYDTIHFKPSEKYRFAERKKFDISDSTFLLGMVARNHPPKDYLTLIEALKYFKERHFNFRCILVGQAVTNLRSEIKKNNLHKHVILQESRNDIEHLYNALDVFILSSFAEACPNVIAEAMSCGVPCIANNVGDCKLLIGDTGILIQDRTAKALCTAIEKMYNEKKLSTWSLKKIYARERIQEHFSFDKMMKLYLKLW